MNESRLLLVAVSVALAAGRIGGLHGQAFQAAAHLFVGGLIGAAIVTRSGRYSRTAAAVALSVVEVLVFLKNLQGT